MGTAVVQLIPVALGFALSPIPLVEMVLVLFSRRALTNGLLFLACIMLPVFVIPFLGAAGQDAAAATASERSTTQGVILIVVAAVLLVIAWRNFRARHGHVGPQGVRQDRGDGAAGGHAAGGSERAYVEGCPLTPQHLATLRLPSRLDLVHLS